MPLQLLGAAQAAPVLPSAAKLAGQLERTPSQKSVGSQVALAPCVLHIVPMGFTPLAGQAGVPAAQTSATSQGPATARQVVPAARKPSVGQAELVPSQVSTASQAAAAGRQGVPAAFGPSCGQAITLLPPAVLLALIALIRLVAWQSGSRVVSPCLRSAVGWLRDRSCRGRSRSKDPRWLPGKGPQSKGGKAWQTGLQRTAFVIVASQLPQVSPQILFSETEAGKWRLDGVRALGL